MSENLLAPFQIHTICRSDFDFSENPNSIYTVGEDLLKKINHDTQGLDTSKDLHDQAFAIASFPSDRSKLVIGSESGRAEIVTNLNIDAAYPIMSFLGPVHRLAISQDEAYIAGSSNECSIAVYKVEQNKMYKPKPANESSCLHVGFSSNVKFVSSSGCEGVVNIYSIEKMEDNPLDCKVRSQKIAKETRLDNSQILRFDWHPKETTLALPGDFALQVLRENESGNWDYSIETEIRHNKEISAVCWNADGSRILTFCVEHAFKLWDYSTKTLLQYFNYDQAIYSVKFNSETNVFGFVSHSGYFGVWKESPKENQMIMRGTELKEELHKNKENELDIDEDEEATIDRLLREKEQESLEEERQKSRDNILPDTFEDIKTTKPTENILTKAFEDESLLREINQQDDEEDRSHAKKVVMTKKTHVNRHADIINTAAQPILYSSSTSLSRGRKFLCWNLMGSIISSQEGQFSAIDVDFANKTFHTNIRILDTYGITMGCMNEKGIVLASKADEIQDDEYEDDLKDDSRRFSHVIFRPLNLLVEREKEWAVPLPEGENVDTIAVGNNWIAAFTDVHFIRFFNFKGLETKLLCLEKPIVCCAGYENYLAFVYHDSPPFLGCQSLKMRVVDVESLSTIFEGSLPLSPNTIMTWFGFSDNGMIVTQDSRGLIRGLFGYKQWWPLYVAEDSRRNPNLWLIGIHEYNFIGVALERGETEPAVQPKPSVKTIKIRLPYIREEEDDTSKQSDIIKKQAILEHEKARNQAWIYQKITREKTDNLYAYSENILDKTGLLHMDESIEKNIVDLFQDYVVNDEHEKALMIASTLKHVKSINICLFLCNQLNAKTLGEKITDLLEARKRLAQVEESQQANAGTANQIVIIKGNESNPILENRNKIKKGLSSFAAQLQHTKRESFPGSIRDIIDEDSSRRPDLPLQDFFNLLEAKENAQDSTSQKASQKKATSSQLSGGSFAAFGKEFTKKPVYDTEAAAKHSSLFETFSAKNVGNPLKRKPDQPLYRDDFKKMK